MEVKRILKPISDDDYFKSVEEKKEGTAQYVKKMAEDIDYAVKHNDYEKFSAILAQDDKDILFDRTLRLYYNICLVVNNEKALLGYSNFLNNISSLEEAINKYTHTVFMLRRIDLLIDDYLTEEAVSYLLTDKTSAVEIYYLITNESFEDYPSLFNSLESFLLDTLPIKEQFFFLSKLASDFPSSSNNIKLASFLIKNKMPKEAFDFLSGLENASSYELNLLNSLKEALNER